MYNEIKSDWSVSQQDIESQVALMKAFLPVDPIGDTTLDKDMFKKLYYSKKCVLAAALLFDPSTYEMGNVYYKDTANSAIIDGFNYYSSIPSNITNSEWFKELSYMPVDTILIPVLERLVNGIVGPNSSGAFVPYQWRTSQLPAKYHIKTDKDNISTALLTLGGIAAIAIVVALVVVGVKVRKSLITKALAADRDFETAIYDKDISNIELRKKQRKAIRANKLAGNFLTPENVGTASKYVDPTISEILYRITGEAKKV